MKISPSPLSFYRWFPSFALLVLGASSATGQSPPQPVSFRVEFELPASPSGDRVGLESAAGWLERHIVRGHFESVGDGGQAGVDRELSIIAWKDPTLHPQDAGALAGYLITDTFWAAVALGKLRPESAAALRHTLDVLGGQSNGLHEVLFGPIPRICHRPADKDFVHGVSVGRITRSQSDWVDVRMFNMLEDHAFTQGHPRLFAEHTGYQALFDHWKNQTKQSQERLRNIFDGDVKTSIESPVVWDHERELLIDQGNFSDWLRINETDRCSQYPIKLGVILYAMRCTGLDREFPVATDALQSRLWQSQRPDGGFAHSIVVDAAGKLVSRSGATGEATALAILAKTVQTPVRDRQ